MERFKFCLCYLLTYTDAPLNLLQVPLCAARALHSVLSPLTVPEHAQPLAWAREVEVR